METTCVGTNADDGVDMEMTCDLDATCRVLVCELSVHLSLSHILFLCMLCGCC